MNRFKKPIHWIFGLLSTVGMLVSANGCVSGYSFSQLPADSNSSGPSSGSGGGVTVLPVGSGPGGNSNGPASTTLQFTEPNTSNRKLDLLFVIHATGTFNQQLSSNVATGLDSFVAGLGNVDYQIAVILAYPGGQSSGVLFNAAANAANGIGPVLSGKLGTAAVATALEADIANAPTDNVTVPIPGTNMTDSLHGEFGTLALLNSLSKTNFAASQGEGFFRPDAALGIIFAANEADNCFIEATDPDSQEQLWKSEFCTGLTTASVISAVDGAAGANPYLFGFIGYASDPLNANGQTIDEKEKGLGYWDIANQTNGAIIDLDPNNMIEPSAQQQTTIATGMGAFGLLAQNKLSLTSNFPLLPGAIASSIQVSMNGNALASSQWSYDPISNSVTIPGVSSTAVVKIQYEYVAPAPSPSASPSPSPSPSPSASPSPSPSNSP